MKPSTLLPLSISATPATLDGANLSRDSIGNVSADPSAGNSTTSESNPPNGDGRRSVGSHRGARSYTSSIMKRMMLGRGLWAAARVKKVQKMAKKGVHEGHARARDTSWKMGSEIEMDGGSD
jgi:hypothetical protein